MTNKFLFFFAVKSKKAKKQIRLLVFWGESTMRQSAYGPFTLLRSIVTQDFRCKTLESNDIRN